MTRMPALQSQAVHLRLEPPSPEPPMVHMILTKKRSSTAAGQAPGMRVVVAVIQRLQALGALAAGQLVRISALEEARR